MINFKFPVSSASGQLIVLPKGEVLVKLLEARMNFVDILKVLIGLLLLFHNRLKFAIWVELA